MRRDAAIDDQRSEYYSAASSESLQLTLEQIFGGVEKTSCFLELDLPPGSNEPVAVYLDGQQIPYNPTTVDFDPSVTLEPKVAFASSASTATRSNSSLFKDPSEIRLFALRRTWFLSMTLLRQNVVRVVAEGCAQTVGGVVHGVDRAGLIHREGNVGKVALVRLTVHG